MKKRILLIALLGIFMGFCWSCSRDDEEEVPTSLQEYGEFPPDWNDDFE